MADKITVPTLGESLTEATVAKWLKKVGDSVQEDEEIVSLETDKVSIDVTAPKSGILSEIVAKDGATVEVGAHLGSIDASASPAKKKEVQQDKQETTVVEIKKEENILEKKIDNQNKKKELSPSVKRIINEKNINIESVDGTGKDGRILKGDLIGLMGFSPAPNTKKIEIGEEERVKMTRLRSTIAKRLKEAQNNAAILTTFNEIDMSMIIQIRKDNKDEFEKRYGTKLGFMSFFVKACVNALQTYPSVNAEVQGEEIVYKNYYNIGVAVGTEKGLVVPVLGNADELSFAEIEKEIITLGTKAKNNQLSIEELQGGTFTITNGGIYGSMLSTPIINPPQSGVLGMHNIVQRAVVINGKIEIRPIMYLALSYDHRIIDGKEAVSFLVRVKEILEDPRRLFLNL
ncbi:dihydrolipoamide succinyltransferase component (E2) of 2-oxoglutarate dehydrogenase complex [Candidatus Pelagibacter sp. IMCC9063]|uniref:2-oxoglutarate dehydrogenase complex dihydrolipoyllysine-residue succinyltransferase n=1 Tax=Pelagibacter sp. (strain IMCC9063) TaxID=1002672 RepID=UPI000204682A|nr:2-oxoglutarate dehydrogenase complex dihydrolipoyllysine-residue succinyltransferase [Candidatus Pelagibacter sp. IMCC9063]AEA80956.1 dihydrolipoamide succinyltransferase component (E2) of 2-oxoglutarate dehydrogenase complex [Candidatus Pelagibacter sp. IMCC9063]|tara:strand:- start:1462 stop:2667 length:1206 start_codon:yes stop_codon:yes gene_type:complete